MAFAFVRVLSLSTSEMQVLFNDDVDTNTMVTNVSIAPQFDSIPAITVRSVDIEGSTVTLSFSPLFPNVQYKVTFSSTEAQPFQTVNGERISEDGNRNSFFIASPGEIQNEIREAMFQQAPEIYPVDEPSTIRNLITVAADQLQKAGEEISTTRSANYLSIDVTDERHERGDGPIDKLANGGAFDILRVASTPTGSTITRTLEFDAGRRASFKADSITITNGVLEAISSDPISLQSVDVINESVSSNTDEANFFDGLKIRVANRPIAQVISVTLVRGTEKIPYDIETFGYTLRDNRYDTNAASINVNLRDDEVELSTSSLTGQPGGFVVPIASDEIRISYVYKRLGRDVDPDSVQLSAVRQVVRERVPAIINRFTLENAPIVNSLDEVHVRGGVEFLNTQSSDGQPPFSTIHPAFRRELRFDILRFPAQPGEYSINYETGEVFVFGVDANNDGTGVSPPVANYLYRKVYVPDLDFTFNSDTDEFAANSTRNVSGIDAKITFDYEDTFADGKDFRLLSHVEALNERVENRLVGEFKIETLNFPVTNVFRILNETTGELYNPVRFNDTSITFTGRRAPVQRDAERERVFFSRVPQEILLVSDKLTNDISLRVLKINLENNGLVDSQGRFIGANFDSSVLFSRADLFIREFFYDTVLATESQNLNRLEQVGDYCINYTNGIVYVAVTSDQDTDLGDISYQHQRIQTRHANILLVNDIYRSQNSLDPNIRVYSIGDVEPTTVNVIGLEQVGERFLNNNSTRPLVVGTYQSGEDGITTKNTDIFISNSAIFTDADVGRTIRIGSQNKPPVEDVVITNIVNEHEVLVTPNIVNTGSGRVWTVLDLSEGAPKTITLENNIRSVKDIFNVSQLGTVPVADLDGYFDIDRDNVIGNVITLGDSNPLQVGDAVMVSYNYGDVFIDYTYLRDNLVVSYEYGNNALDWSASNALDTGQEYFVTYKYGALRDSLLTNFGSLTQIDQLTNFSPNLDRELYRNILSGTLQSFLEGPTIPSIERLVEAFTDVTPNIIESVFQNWVLGRDYLYLRGISTSETETFDLGKFSNGVSIDNSDRVDVPALAHVRVNEGTMETWVRPSWKGLSNDSTLTFADLQIDGYTDPNKVFIGFSAANPSEIPFDLSTESEDISVLGEPNNIDSDTGFFIWFDETNDSWQIRWRENRNEVHNFTGRVTSTGEFFNVVKPVGPDGYEINEITDVITSSIQEIRFEAFIDGYDALSNTTTYALDGLAFASGDEHYIFDMGIRPDANRMSIFKDGTGYLNFQVYDNQVTRGYDAGFYNLSHNIQDWEPNELHHVAVSWKFNSPEEKDEMHLFIDGAEVPNLFKYGGNPKASSSFDFGDVAEETVISSAIRPIVGGFDGNTESGDTLFRSLDTDFEALGIEVGDSLSLLDDTPDGTGDPNFGLPYTVTGVGGNTLTVDRPFTLTLGNLTYSINSVTATVTTEVNFQDVAVFAIDADGNETELQGIDSDEPDYSIRRGDDHTHVITINDGVGFGEAVVIKPLGLIFKRCKERIFSYGSSDTLKVNSAPPVSLDDVKITSIILPRTLISTGGGFGLIGTVIGAQLVTLLQSYFADPCQPSNSSAGRKLAIRLSGDNVNYDIPGNQVIITGTTYSGATQEIVLFTENGVSVTSEYWKTIESIVVSVIPIDATQPVGIVEIKENNPITVSENNGDFAEVVDFSNGLIKLETFGTGGAEYLLNPCLYEVDYPTFLRIGLDGTPDTFQIGSNMGGTGQFDGVIDEFRILDTLSEDTRVGEELETGERSITTDFNTGNQFIEDSNTLFLAHFDDDTDDSSDFYDRFNAGVLTASSVNSEFGTAALFDRTDPLILSNAGSVFTPNEGTIEFWVSPLDDTKGDPNFHYYVDMTSTVTETLESSTSVSVIISQRAREIRSVRLASDVFQTGTNYATGGSLSNVDRRTVTLGTPLPGQNVAVVVTYVPLSAQGDQVSIFRDPQGFVNFFVKASGVEHLITVHVDWKRHTWHRVMVMWKMNSPDNQDRLRLFVDGSERGTIRYGTGLIYGTGVVYGQAEVRPGVNRFLVDNIDMTDTFSRIYIGSDVLARKSARARMDNIRFSEIQRLQGIKVTTNDTIDINFSANPDSAIPVVEDVFTTRLINANDVADAVDFLATIINAERGIFRFEVEVIDSFDKVIGNTQLEELLEELINVIKPAHTEAIVTFLE